MRVFLFQPSARLWPGAWHSGPSAFTRATSPAIVQSGAGRQSGCSGTRERRFIPIPNAIPCCLRNQSDQAGKRPHGEEWRAHARPFTTTAVLPKRRRSVASGAVHAKKRRSVLMGAVHAKKTPRCSDQETALFTPRTGVGKSTPHCGMEARLAQASPFWPMEEHPALLGQSSAARRC